MSDIDPNKLKVAELREELKNRGLDTKGTKAVLVKRLKKALDAESGAATGLDESVTEVDTSHDATDESSQDAVQTMDDSSQEPVEQTPADPEPIAVDPEPVTEVPEPVVAEEAPAEESNAVEEMNAEEENKLLEETEEEEPAVEDLQTVDEATCDDEEVKEDEKKAEKRKRSRSRSRDRQERHRRRSRDRSRSRERRGRSPRKVVMDDDTWEASTQVLLDKYNSDINLKIDATGYKAEPLTHDGFAMMWAGARGTYGVTKGKVAFEVKLVENLYLDQIGQEENNPHVARVGWSVDTSSMQLGEEALSYGYGGTAKASTDCKFEDYGEKYTAGDVITAYVDFEDDETVYISYAKNGEELGVCFTIEKPTLEDKVLYPHVLTKNTSFEVNFGAQEEPWFPLKEDFVFIEQLAVEERIRGTTPPAKKEDCEMIMMVGLPGCGKTTWATKHAVENPDKKYYILGTNNIIDKMKVMGLPRKRNYAGRWDVLIDLSTKCLNKMLEMGSSKKRNYILDQTNVYASARRRKMQPFEGFQRKAVVIVPTDEDFKNRIEQREKEEGKEVPERAVLEMKANFSLPEEGVMFDSIELIEQDKEAIDTLIAKYNKEGKDALPPPEKRFRDGGGSRFGGQSGGRFERRDRWSRDDNRGHDNRSHNRYNDRRGGSGNYNRGPRSYGGGGGSGGGGSYHRENRSSGYSRNDRNDRNERRFSGGNDRRSGGGGDWKSRNQGRYEGRSSSGWSNKSQGSWGNQGSWGSQGGNWGNQGGNWGNQSGYGQWNYAQGNTGNQGYGWNQSWGGQNYWQGYNQQGQGQSGHYQNWGYGSNSYK